MKQDANGLSVLEYPYTYAAWKVDPENHDRAFSERKAFSKERRALEDYHLCGVYHKAGVPFTVTEINGFCHPELEPFQSIPLQLAQECEKAIRAGEKVLIPSGYCALAPAVVGGIQQATGTDKKIGVLWVDAHCDNVIVEKTVRSDLRFVGIPLSTIAGQTMERITVGWKYPAPEKTLSSAMDAVRTTSVSKTCGTRASCGWTRRSLRIPPAGKNRCKSSRKG